MEHPAIIEAIARKKADDDYGRVDEDDMVVLSEEFYFNYDILIRAHEVVIANIPTQAEKDSAAAWLNAHNDTPADDLMVQAYQEIVDAPLETRSDEEMEQSIRENYPYSAPQHFLEQITERVVECSLLAKIFGELANANINLQEDRNTIMRVASLLKIHVPSAFSDRVDS